METELTCQFVRPDRLLFEGTVASVVLITHTGELGVYPGHAAEIVALGEGVIRLTHTGADGGGVVGVLTMGGYAEITPESVIVLADHARRTDDIDVPTVQRTREAAVAERDALDAKDHRRAYWDNKVAWCDLLLKTAQGTDGQQAAAS